MKITYIYRGDIERPPNYSWYPGYSEDSAEGWVTYPWMTSRECKADAKSRGATAEFVWQGGWKGTE
jgi:hypothetical protein